jgi:Na+-translocating ferredoxin:NAD+ oxidoreductase subunit B
MIADLADRIDAVLPQTQCTKCGYPSCRRYAIAIAAGEADLNQCPPGGEAGIARLAALLGREAKPLNPANGVERPRRVALIDEARCIGCTLCIHACPVDAIAGASQLMHTVLLEHCTGCELCLPPCPVDCIEMISIEELVRRGAALSEPDPERSAARSRYAFRQLRLQRDRSTRTARMRAKSGEPAKHEAVMARLPDVERKRAAVRAALERARARRAVTRA